MKKYEDDQDLAQIFAKLDENPMSSELTPAQLRSWREEDPNRGAFEEFAELAAQAPDAARLLLDARQFPDLQSTPEEERILANYAARDGWSEIQQRLSLAPSKADRGLLPTTSSASPRRRLMAVAATFLVGLLVGVLIPGSSPSPLVNPAVVEFPQIAETIRVNSTIEKQASAGSSGLELAFDVVGLASPGSAFGVKLMTPDGRLVNQLDAVTADSRGILRIVWPNRFLPGSYIVELSIDDEKIWEAQINLSS